MRRLARRRTRNILAAALLAAAILVLFWARGATLARDAMLTGWVLAAVMVLLASYNLRKKLPFLSLGASAIWLQVHLYAGWITIVLFLVHGGFRTPNGWLEGILTATYVVVAGSGLFGIALSRISAPRLTRTDEGILYERIPSYRAAVRARVEELVLQSVTESDASTIADFYTAKLVTFFTGPRNLLLHLIGSTRPRHLLLAELGSLNRYLREGERRTLQDIADLVRQKDDLDQQHAIQSALKWWLFVHIPLTYVLLILTAVHILLVYSFRGGAG